VPPTKAVSLRRHLQLRSDGKPRGRHTSEGASR
jgi:hypothetical protein